MPDDRNLTLSSRVSRGKVAGITKLHKFGFASVPNSEVTVWDGNVAYSYLAAASKIKVSSDADADTAAGTGARTVEVIGLDGDYNEVMEIVTLSGKSAVETDALFIRVFRLKVLTAGSGGANAGNIYAGTGTVPATGIPPNKYAQITIGENQTLMAMWTVPAGKNFAMGQLLVGCLKADNVIFRVRVREFGSVFQTKIKIPLYQSDIQEIYSYPMVVPAKADIEVTAISGGGDASCRAEFLGEYL